MGADHSSANAFIYKYQIVATYFTRILCSKTHTRYLLHLCNKERKYKSICKICATAKFYHNPYLYVCTLCHHIYCFQHYQQHLQIIDTAAQFRIPSGCCAKHIEITIKIAKHFTDRNFYLLSRHLCSEELTVHIELDPYLRKFEQKAEVNGLIAQLIKSNNIKKLCDSDY